MILYNLFGPIVSEFNTVRREKKSLFALFKAAAGEIQSNRDCTTYTNFIRDLGIESSSIQSDLIISRYFNF